MKWQCVHKGALPLFAWWCPTLWSVCIDLQNKTNTYHASSVAPQVSLSASPSSRHRLSSSTVPGLESRTSCEHLCILAVCGWTFHFLFLPNTILWSSGCFSGCTDKMCGCEGLDVTVRGVVISYEPPPSPRWLFLWTRLLFFFFSAKKFVARRLINRRDGCRLSALMLPLQLKHEAQTDYYSLSSS